MSDAPASTLEDSLDLDHAQPHAEAKAETGAASTQLTCTACTKAIVGKYFAVNGRYACEACSGQVINAAQGGGSFIRALLLGAGAAIAGALVYYGIVAVTNLEIGLIAIALGYCVGKAVRIGAGLRPGKRYRALALLLTYWSITAMYIPGIMEASETPSVIFAGIFALALPVVMLASFDNLLGLIILGIGLYEAWKHSAAPQVIVEGPFALDKPASPVQPEPAVLPAPAEPAL
jgi:hypothetical protein